jgi:hypothetical protein
LVLLVAVFLGLIAARIRAVSGKRSFHNPHLSHLWIVFVAYVPQAFVFALPTRNTFPDSMAAAALVASLVLLLVFVWFNRSYPGFWALGLGLAMNLAVISLNGGLMPISPDTLATWSPDVPTSAWEIGKRFGMGKDIVLAASDTRLWFLSDRFITPHQFSYHVAYSLGDIFIAIGAFLLLWSLGGPTPSQELNYRR